MKKVLVIGGARSGSAVARLLKKKGYEVLLTDKGALSNKHELEEEGIIVFDEGHPDSLKEETYEFVVKNPGIPYHNEFIQFFLKQGIPMYTEIEVASWYAKNFHYGAITGTNGKTTTTTMLHTLLSTQFTSYTAGNIGTPLSELVLQHEDEEVYVALELSNFQLLGCKTFKPQVSTVLNLTPDHLDYMDSLEAYYTSKMKIYESTDKSDYFLRNIDDTLVMEYAINIPCNVLDMSLEKQADIYDRDDKIYYKDIVLFEIKDLALVGRHNVANATVAATMAYLLGVSIENIQKGIKQIKAVEHRLEYVDTVQGVSYYNDSKATNAEAVVPALLAFKEPVILLAGGYDKGLPFDMLKEYRGKVKKCFAFGQTKHKFEDIFDCVICEDLKEAMQKANEFANEGDVVLLSPACASYGQFKNYEERGNIFKEYVHKFKQGERL